MFSVEELEVFSVEELEVFSVELESAVKLFFLEVFLKPYNDSHR